MSEAESLPTDLVLYDDNINLEQWGEVCYGLMEESSGSEGSELPTIPWVAAKLEITTREALAIISHPKFSSFFHNMMISIAKAEFDRSAYKRMVEVIRTGSDANSVAAAKFLSKALGYTVDTPLIHLSFEEVLSKHGGSKSIDTTVKQVYPGLD